VATPTGRRLAAHHSRIRPHMVSLYYCPGPV